MESMTLTTPSSSPVKEQQGPFYLKLILRAVIDDMVNKGHWKIIEEDDIEKYIKIKEVVYFQSYKNGSGREWKICAVDSTKYIH